MENIEKYVFDPKNPENFFAYKILLKIIKSEKYSVYVSPSFVLYYFADYIFDKEVKEDIYSIDKKELNSLSGLHLAEIYAKDYSIKDLEEVIVKKLSVVDSNNLLNLFANSFFYLEENNFSNELYFFESSKVSIRGFQNFYPKFQLKNKKPSNDRGSLSQIKKNNIIFFLTIHDNGLLKELLFEKACPIVFPAEQFTKFVKVNSLAKNYKPILINSRTDLDILISNLLYQTSKKKRANLQKEISTLTSLSAKNYFSIKQIDLNNLQNKSEIYFIGENGDGKSLVLQTILLSLIGNQAIGIISDFLTQNNSKKFEVNSIDSLGIERKYNKKSQFDNIFAYGVNRFQNDSDKKDQHGFLSLFSHDEYLESPVKWLQHLDYQEKSGNTPDITLIKAKELLNDLLEENVQIEVSPEGVDFFERGAKLKFDQLSDGYKSVLVWMCDLLSRLSTKQPNVDHISQFQGIVLVDEIGMFLHPKWQRTIVKKLRTTFPLIQFFFTTHSPIVLLGASEDAVFYKVYKEDGETKIADPIENKSLGHLMANGILTAPFLFGLENAHSESYNPKTDDLDTSDDYLTGKIHEVVTKKIANENNISEHQIMDLIQQELDKYQAAPNK